MDEKLTHILEHVARLSGQNPEFRRALCDKLKIKEAAPALSPPREREAGGGQSESKAIFSLSLTPDDVAGLREFRSSLGLHGRPGVQPVPAPVSPPAFSGDAAADLRVLRSALQLRGRPSMDYNFVTDARVRDQLLADNLRMENAALMTRRDLLLVTHERRSVDEEALLGEHTRLDLFAIAAFNQLECLTNWFLAWSYPDIDDFIEAVEEVTETLDYPYKAPASGEKGRPASVEEVSMFHKMNALMGMLALGDVKDSLNYLRNHRNNCIHRGETVKEETVKMFHKYNSFGTIRTLLGRVVDAVRKDVAEQLRAEEEEREAERRKLAEQGVHPARVVQNFTGFCQLDVDGVGKMTVPSPLLSKVTKLKMGDSVQVKVADGKIVEIKVPSC